MFNPQEHKSGKWLKFELGGESLELLLVQPSSVKIGKVDSKLEIQTYLDKAQRSGDGRLVGIFIKGGKLRVPASKVLKKNEAGEPINIDGVDQYDETPERFIEIPDSVAPQRAIAVDGHRNLEWHQPGDAMVHTMLLPLSSLKNVDLVLVRDDIPPQHNATLDPDFDPALSTN